MACGTDFDFDDEAKKVLGRLNLRPGPPNRYNHLDDVWQHPETGAKAFVGNVQAAQSQEILARNNITSIVK